MQLSAYDTLEVIYLYRPLGITLGERSVRNVNVRCRDGNAEELLKLPLFNGRLLLFVLTPQQFSQARTEINRLVEKSSGTGEVAFLIVENPTEPSTIRQRKRFQQALSSSWVVGDLRAPYTFNQVLNEINKATNHLFLSANQALLGSMVAIREVESRAINEVGLAMTSQSSVDELMRLILDKAIELSTADAGFLVLRENLMTQPTSTDENAVKLLRNSGGKFVQKARSCKSQNVRLNPVMLDPQKSAFTSFIVNKACGVSWAEGMEYPVFRRMNYGTNEIQIPFPELEFDDRNYHY